MRQMYGATTIFETRQSAVLAYRGERAKSGQDRPEDRLLSSAALHKNEQLLRIGWIWFSGTVERNGESVRYCFPALSVPVARPWRVLAAVGAGLHAVGDLEITELVDDPATRARLLAGRQFGGGALNDYTDFATYGATSGDNYRPVDPRILGRLTRLNSWIRDIAKAVELGIDQTVAVHELDPLERRMEAGICVHVCCAMYMDKPAAFGTRRESLLNLASLPKLENSALSKMYVGAPPSSGTSTELVEQIRPISVRQRRVATDLLSEDFSVLSGAPGTGKSHLLTVIALNAVARGQSVLVAASSPFAVDVLVEHFAAAPGPTPVVFGGSSHSQRLATELATMVSDHADTRTAPSEVASEHDEQVASVTKMLLLESEALRLSRDPARQLQGTEDLRRAGDLFELDELVARIERGGVGGWWARRRSRDTLRQRLGQGDARTKLEELQRTQGAQSLLASGGLTLTAMLDHMVSIEDNAATQRGKQMTAAWLDGLSASQRRALTRISTALTNDRGTRRAMLAALDPEDLVAAAPLWVGSVRDIDLVLPSVVGMFDLVILDEASQLDQINATNALVRAKRAIICGDPQQLGHVSFISDADVEAAAATHRTDPKVLDPRRLSTFDAAAMTASPRVLDEHFRSAPHLIEFSGRQIYNNSLHIASRHPINEAADHIDVHVVDGERAANKVNQAEVDECLRVADDLIAQGWDSIGFVSPFRAQADAIEEAVLERYRLDEIEHYGLRVGTVHSFQGDERRVMIASWAIGEDEGSGAWRFVNQRNLFNVMVTRAREHMVIVTSTESPPGLAGDYLRWSEPLLNIIGDVEVADPWVQRVATAVRDTGVDVRTGYRVGRHTIDLVIGSGEDAVAVDCSPHSDGPAAHIDRALQLRRTGWRTADAFQTKWADDVGRLGIELAALVPDSATVADEEGEQ